MAAAGVMALGAQTAAAAPDVVKYDTSLENGHKENRWYHGYVRSKATKCERGRRVVLFKKRPGTDREVDHDRSDRKGWWEFVPHSRGHFYAQATRERHKGFVCLAARAPTVNFEQVPE